MDKEPIQFKFHRVAEDYRISREDLTAIIRAPIQVNSRLNYELICRYLKQNSVKRLSDFPRELRGIASKLIKAKEIDLMKRLGLDVGTKNLVLAVRDGETVKFRREVNGFCRIERTDNIAKSTLKDLKIPFIMANDNKALIALGSKAEEIAYTFGTSLRRPMERGVLSVSEKEALEIMAVIIRAMIGKIEQDTVLYYCIPADAINAETNVAYHQKIVQLIIDGHNKVETKAKLIAHPINEARALVFSEFKDKTGIGISWGAGMVNVSFCLFGLPVYEFSIVGSGDWIDYESARAAGLLEEVDHVKRPKALVAKVKEDTDLSSVPSDNLQRAIYLNYQILIERVAKAIVDGFRNNEKQARAQRPMPIVLAGGTSMPNGFLEMFKGVFAKSEIPFEVGEIRRSSNPLFAVAEGCLIASEAHE